MHPDGNAAWDVRFPRVRVIDGGPQMEQMRAEAAMSELGFEG